MNRPRLFYVLDSLEENEAGDQVATLLSRIPRSRWEPRVVALAGHGSLGGRIREMKVTVHRLELSGPLGALLAVPRLRKLAAGLRAEVLHAFQPWSGAVSQLAAPRGARVYRWIQGHATEPRTLEERLQAWLERRAAYRRGRRFFVSDEEAREEVRARYRLDELEVVPQCVDLAADRDRVLAVGLREARVHLGMSEGQRALLAFSDFRDGSRVAQLLEGFAMARTENPALRLFVRGKGPEEGAARWLAEDLRLEDSLVFLGADTTREASLRAAEAVVDAGSWPGWCRGAVKALAMGLPVLRWTEDGADADQERYPGVTSGPAGRFARDLLDLMEDDERRRSLGRTGRELAQAYDVSVVAERWSRLYGA